MERKKLPKRVGPEAIIQSKIVGRLKELDWSIRQTHGNLYQWGLPDLYCAHAAYGTRWIEVKDPNRRGNLFTNAQREYFYELNSKNVGVWVLTGHSDSEIAKLFKPQNWFDYLQVNN